MKDRARCGPNRQHPKCRYQHSGGSHSVRPCHSCDSHRIQTPGYLRELACSPAASSHRPAGAGSPPSGLSLAASAWLAAGVDIVSVAAWLGDTVKTVYETYAHLMPDADDRGRKAMNAFFTAAEGSCALDVPSDVPR